MGELDELITTKEVWQAFKKGQITYKELSEISFIQMAAVLLEQELILPKSITPVYNMVCRRGDTHVH
jgi:iron only hydrogenase large subunit-like protein